MASPARRRAAFESGMRVAKRVQLERKLGEGGMGAVWSARNLATKADVAVKVLHADQHVRLDAAERFRYEARLGATLAHRNITRVYDLIDTGESLLLVMELLRGETLSAHLAKHRALSNEQAVAVMLPILSALAHAHDHGVVHRDIKPSNIFLNVEPDGRVIPKLLDFGIAKTDGSDIETKTGDALGTPSYMSPEQVRAKHKLDGRSDLFSIGVVLYEVITGVNPFRTQATSGTLARILEEEVDPDPKIDPRIWVELKRALSKQAYERHASARELGTALCDALGKSETLLTEGLSLGIAVDPFATDITRPTLAPPPRRTRTWLVAVAIAAVVATTAVFALRSPTSTASSPPPPVSAPSPAPSPAASAAVAAAPVALELPPPEARVPAKPAKAGRVPKAAPVPVAPPSSAAAPAAASSTQQPSVARTPGF